MAKTTCYRCALPLENAINAILCCGNCLQNPPVFNHTVALFRYTSPIDHLLNQIKFKQRLVYADVLGTLLATKIQQTYQHKTLPDAIIPVPLHKKRLRQRGYNQALELAKPIAKRLRIKIDKFNCQRTRDTPSQMELTASQRQQNLQGAFLAQRTPAEYIAIIDDVMTTGSTILELSKTLQRAGVKKIDVWICARTTL